MENNEWWISKEVVFEIEDKAFAEGGFCMAYKAKSDDESVRGKTWVVKKYSVSSKETFEKMGETCESQSRKTVQMSCLVWYFSVSLSIEGMWTFWRVFQLKFRAFWVNKSRVCNSRGVFTSRFPEVY